MNISITKVKKKAIGRKNNSVEVVPSWRGVLEDVQANIERLKQLVPIIERKIKRGGPWPGTQSQDQNSEEQHSV